MRITPLVLVAGLSTTVFLGCGEQPDRASQDAIDRALEKLAVAEQGYLPGGAGPDMTLQQHRLQTMQGTMADLDAAIQQGGPEQKVIASRLKASILLTEARTASRAGAVAYSDVGARAGAIVRYLDAVNRSSSRVRRLDRDGGASIEQLQTTRAQQQQAGQQAGTTAAKLRQSVQELQGRQAEFKQQASQLIQESQQLRQQAFVAEGQERAELEDLGAQRQLESQRVQTQADELATQLEQLESELRLAEAEQQLSDRTVQMLAEMVRGVEQGQQVTQENLAKAQQDRSQAVEAMVQAFENVWQRYQTDVQQPFDQASQAAQQAVSTMQQAVSAAQTSEQRSSAQRGLLEALTTRASILADRAMAAGGFGGSVQVLAQQTRELAPDAASRFQQAFDQIRQNQQQVIAAANQVLQEGQQVAGNVSDAAAEPQKQSLAYYAQQISQSALQ